MGKGKRLEQGAKCCICQSKRKLSRWTDGKIYCGKHYTQLITHGKISERTRFDLNEIILFDDYAEIVIYNNDCLEIARTQISLNKVELVKDYKWSLNHGYVCTWTNGNKRIKLHKMLTNPPEGMLVDHIDRNKLNNRDENLRICTKQQNLINRTMSRSNTSGVVGVEWREKYKIWTAQIGYCNERIYLGCSKDKEEAIRLRKEAERKYFGEFAPDHQEVKNIENTTNC
jgi:hypothetical protein